MLRCCYVIGWGLGGVGWGNNVHVTCIHTWCYAAATSLVGVWVGWGGVEWGNNVHVTCIHMGCNAAATSLVGICVGWLLPYIKHANRYVFYIIYIYIFICIYSYMILLSLSHAVSTLRCEYYVSQIHNTLRCTLLVHTGGIVVCGKFPKVQCQLLGAHAKMGLLI